MAPKSGSLSHPAARGCGAAGLRGSPRAGSPSFVRLTTRRRKTPCRLATRPKNLGYGEARPGTRLKATTDQGEKSFMFKRSHILLAASAIAAFAAVAPAQAEDSVKIGLILPMTGGQASTGKQIDNAIKLYMQQHGDTVAGKKIEIILKDDGALPDKTKTAAQELIVNDKVSFIAGFGVTPAALAAAPLATQGKVPEVVMAAGTSIITERSPYIVRTSFTLAQSSTIIGDWAAKNGIQKVPTLTSDYAPGNDALTFFKQNFTAGGGEVVEEVKVPLANPDFAPFLQRMKDSKPDAVFVFVPAGQGGNFIKE